MKNLRDIILEKLKVDDISLVKKEFPIDGTINEIIEFLKDAGFKKVPSYAGWNATVENFKKNNVKCFSVNIGATTIVEIIDRSNHKLKNKLFTIKLSSYYNIDDKYTIDDDMTAKTDANVRTVPKEDFLKELSEIL